MGEIPFEPQKNWRPVSFIYVEYIEGDLLGKLIAIFSLLPIFIAVGHFMFFVAKRDMHTLTYGVGIILNYVFNIVLKNTIQESRPSRRDAQKIWQEYGMPSSHSQFMWFFSVYMTLFMTFRLPFQRTKLEAFWKTSWCIGCLAASLLVAAGRVYLEYHTTRQVVVGAVIGSLCAWFWFVLTQRVFTKWFPTIVSWRISEFFIVRDYTDIPNVWWFDYTHARAEAKTRSKRKSRKEN